MSKKNLDKIIKSAQKLISDRENSPKINAQDKFERSKIDSQLAIEEELLKHNIKLLAKYHQKTADKLNKKLQNLGPASHIDIAKELVKYAKRSLKKLKIEEKEALENKHDTKIKKKANQKIEKTNKLIFKTNFEYGSIQQKAYQLLREKQYNQLEKIINSKIYKAAINLQNNNLSIKDNNILKGNYKKSRMQIGKSSRALNFQQELLKILAPYSNEYKNIKAIKIPRSRKKNSGEKPILEMIESIQNSFNQLKEDLIPAKYFEEKSIISEKESQIKKEDIFAKQPIILENKHIISTSHHSSLSKNETNQNLNEFKSEEFIWDRLQKKLKEEKLECLDSLKKSPIWKAAENLKQNQNSAKNNKLLLGNYKKSKTKFGKSAIALNFKNEILSHIKYKFNKESDIYRDILDVSISRIDKDNGKKAILEIMSIIDKHQDKMQYYFDIEYNPNKIKEKTIDINIPASTISDRSQSSSMSRSTNEGPYEEF